MSAHSSAIGTKADLICSPSKTVTSEFEELRQALARLPDDQRESLILVGAAGIGYEEAAKICGCAVGTIKSCAHRARLRLAELLAVESAFDFGLDQISRAVLTANHRSQ